MIFLGNLFLATANSNREIWKLLVQHLVDNFWGPWLSGNTRPRERKSGSLRTKTKPWDWHPQEGRATAVCEHGQPLFFFFWRRRARYTSVMAPPKAPSQAYLSAKPCEDLITRSFRNNPFSSETQWEGWRDGSVLESTKNRDSNGPGSKEELWLTSAVGGAHFFPLSRIPMYLAPSTVPWPTDWATGRLMIYWLILVH